MATFLQGIENSGLFGWVVASEWAYPVLLWLHLIAVTAWAGVFVLTSLQTGKVGSEYRRVRLGSLVVAAVCGLLLFGAKAGQYDYNPWFWVKLLLLALVGVCAGVFRGNRVALVGSTVVLLAGAVMAARGPATIRDLMHAMIDPSAEFLFNSVQTIADERGITEIAPKTDEEWKQVRARAEVLMGAPDVVTAPGRRAARPRDRAASPEVELETAQLQAKIQAQRADFELRGQKLRDAVTVVMKAIDAKDKDRLLDSLNGIDEACEGCHVRYWYPNDKRAVEAAREAGILE